MLKECCEIIFREAFLCSFSGREKPIVSTKHQWLLGHSFEAICSGTENQKSKLTSFNLFPRDISLPWLAAQMGWQYKDLCMPWQSELQKGWGQPEHLRWEQTNEPLNVQAMIPGPLVLSGAFPRWDSSDRCWHLCCRSCNQCACTISREKPAHVSTTHLMLKPMSETGEERNPQQFFVLFISCAGRQQGQALTDREGMLCAHIESDGLNANPCDCDRLLIPPLTINMGHKSIYPQPAGISLQRPPSWWSDCFCTYTLQWLLLKVNDPTNDCVTMQGHCPALHKWHRPKLCPQVGQQTPVSAAGLGHCVHMLHLMFVSAQETQDMHRANTQFRLRREQIKSLSFDCPRLRYVATVLPNLHSQEPN